MAISITIDSSNIERKATVIYVPFVLTNPDNQNNWDFLRIKYKDSSAMTWKERSLDNCCEYQEETLHCYAVIPNVLSTNAKNEINIEIVGGQSNGSIHETYTSGVVTVPWSSTYFKRTAKLNIVSITRAKTKMSVILNAISYYSSMQKWTNIYVDYKKTTENSWTTYELPSKVVADLNMKSIFSYDLKEGWVATNGDSAESYDTHTCDRKYNNTSVDLIVDKYSTYDVRIRGSMLIDGPDDIFTNIISATKTAEVTNYYKYRLCSLSITSNKLYPVLGEHNKKMTKMSLSVEIVNRTGNNWNWIKLKYCKDDEDEITVINLISLSDGKQTFTVPLNDNFENDSTYLFWLEGEFTYGEEDIHKDSEVMFFDTITHAKPSRSLVRLFEPKNGEWWNLTPLIKVPNYNVMNNWITEEWDDANYVTHTVGIRQRIEGEFQLSFDVLPIADEDIVGNSRFASLNPREAYYKFLDILRTNQNEYGPNRIKMAVHMNNIIDTDVTTTEYDMLEEDEPLSLDDLPYAKCDWKFATFYIKISEIPWQIPWYDMPNKEIEPIKITIKEE